MLSAQLIMSSHTSPITDKSYKAGNVELNII